MNKIGKFGEDIACVFLMKHGYKVMDRNYSKKWGELDIVAKKGKKVLFVEVKTVSCGTSLNPEDNMHPVKIKKFVRIIETYREENGIKNLEYAAALIAIRVDLKTKMAKVRFIEDLIL